MVRNAARAFTSAVVLVLLVGGNPASGGEHPRGLHTASDMQIVRGRVVAGREPWLSAYKDLISRADKALARVPQPVADFDVPGYYTSGQDEHIRMKTLLSEETSAAYACAVAYNVAVQADTVKRARYGAKAAEILTKWASVNKSVSGADGNLVMSYNGNKMAVAGDLIYSKPVWTDAQRSSFSLWVRNVLLKSGDAIDTKGNNWGDWGTLAVIVSCCFLDDDSRLTAMVQQVQGRISSNIASDGHIPDETGRGGNGMWYTYFALAPLTESCFILNRVARVNILSVNTSSGQRVEKALDFFLPYCKNPGSWPYATVTNLPSGASPQGWPGNLYEAMAELYNNQGYEAYAQLGRPHYRNSTGLAWVASTLFKGTYNASMTAVMEPIAVARQAVPTIVMSCIRLSVPGPELVSQRGRFSLTGKLNARIVGEPLPMHRIVP